MEKKSIEKAKPKICFIAHSAYGAMTGGNNGHIGGVERQISLMAKWFANCGYEVSVITWDEGQQDCEEIDGVLLFKMCRRNGGIPGLRFFWPRWSSLVAAMKRADADIYYQNLAECVTGQAAYWCHKHKRKFIFSSAADSHCDARLRYMHSFRDRVLYKYGLKHADKIIVQSRRQHEMMKNNFGHDSVILSMPCPGPSDTKYVDYEREQSGSQRVLWIGRIYELKRPDRLLDVAVACPDLQFDIVGPAADTAYTRRVCERAKTISNVTLHGPVSRKNVPEFYKKAKILCCTSDFEGFPNTFLEAWSYGLPIVSTFDPDGLITGRGLGKVGKDVSELANAIRKLLDSPERWRKASKAARQYYVENHTLEMAMPGFENAFLGILNREAKSDVYS
jgi:glycosyltransferase involved in cell wall biosynthesis